MRVISILVAAVVIALPVASASSRERTDVGAGLSVVPPRGWHLSRWQVTTCSDPVQRLLATFGRAKIQPALRVPSRGALVLLMEAKRGRFPARPAKFTLPHPSNLAGCCEIPSGPGAELLFRDHGRRFYAFVYIGARAAPEARPGLLRLLNSLRVSSRR